MMFGEVLTPSKENKRRQISRATQLNQCHVVDYTPGYIANLVIFAGTKIMTPSKLTSQLEELSTAIGTNAATYKDSEFWVSVGENELDQQLTRLADIFIAAPKSSQQTIREAVHQRALWNPIAFVRRMSILLIATSDPIWLRRALAVAAIEDGRFDFRDLIVSLVIARAAAEQVGIDHVPHFNWCVASFSPTSHDSFTNARDHSSADILDILRSFGPSELLKSSQTTNGLRSSG